MPHKSAFKVVTHEHNMNEQDETAKYSSTIIFHVKTHWIRSCHITKQAKHAQNIPALIYSQNGEILTLSRLCSIFGNVKVAECFHPPFSI